MRRLVKSEGIIEIQNYLAIMLIFIIYILIESAEREQTCLMSPSYMIFHKLKSSHKDKQLLMIGVITVYFEPSSVALNIVQICR